MDKRSSKLGRKINRLITVGMCIIGALFLIGCAYAYSHEINEIYNKKISEVTLSVGDQVDADFISRLYELAVTDEFRDIYNNASYENQQPIIDYLKEQGVYEDYTELNDMIEHIRENMGLSYLYIEVFDGGDTGIYIVEPMAGYYAFGGKEDIIEEYGEIMGNEHIDATVSRTQFGWLSSGGEPLYDDAGNAVAVILADIDMNEIMGKRIAFIVIMLIELIIVIGVTQIVLSKCIAKDIIEPVRALTDNAEHFGTGEEGFSKDNIIELDIRTGDEIEDMYHMLRFMQESIIDYMDNLQSVTAERERIGAEVEIATAIQQSMLEHVAPDFVGKNEYDLFASMTPAREVGGDFYDFFMVDENHIAILIADVSDKGVGSAFFMAIAKTLIKTYAQMGGTPEEIITNVDKRISEKNDAGLFVTVWFAIVDLNTGHVNACNAGHDYPAIMKVGEDFVIEKTPHGPPVAFIPGMEFAGIEFDMKPGDRIFLYTDGVNEAKREDGERFGTDRMLEVLNAHKDVDNEEMIHIMKAAVDEFAGDEPQFDDMTMLGFTFKGREK